MKKEKAKKTKKVKGFLADFKAFISRGNAVDLAVGVVIGGAFGAIVNALVNILLNLCMWGVPGGLAGLVTILPAASPSQIPPEGYKQVYTVGEFMNLQVTEQALYTKHGGKYIYSGCSVLDWGALINAVITFIIIAVVLFTVIKVIGYFNRLKEEAKAKAKEEYYEKHPEERPAPVEPGTPEPTETELLTEIRDLLKKEKAK